MPYRITLFLSIFFMAFGALIIARGIEFVMNPIAHLSLAPLMLFPAGGLFLFVGYHFPRVFGKK